MNTLLLVVIVVAVILMLCWLLLCIDKKQKRKSLHHIMHRFSQVGSENSLSFSSQAILKRNIIGVDGLHRKLLVLTVMDDGECRGRVVALDQVKSCSVKRLYGPINADELHLQRLEEHVQRIVLHFELKNGEAPVAVSFYDQADNSVHECRELEQKARDWETILSKMLKAPLRKRA